MNENYSKIVDYEPTIKSFEPYIFSINKLEKEMLLICISHLNYNNFKNENIYDDYKKHHEQYLPDVKINTLKSKLNNVGGFGGQIMFTKPEIEWLIRGVQELTEYSLEDIKESTINSQNLDYTEVKLNILTEMSIAIDKESPQELWEEYNSLTKNLN